jgi:AAA domain
MINVCFQCGAYRADKIIDPDGALAICPECGFRHRFVQMPLLVVSGASGAGKSTVCNILVGNLSDVVVLDSDILWRAEFDTPSNNYRVYFDLWLRMCKNISQSGRPVVLFGAGFGVPGNVEPCVERRYFTSVEYLALVCSERSLVERLEGRPIWRDSREPAFIEAQIRFNRWFKDYGASEPPIELLDTTDVDEMETSRQVRRWIEERLNDASIRRSRA